jgi:hypothetical protein
VWKEEVATNSAMVTSVIVSCDKNGIGSEQGKNRGRICISRNTGFLIEMVLFLQQEQYL